MAGAAATCTYGVVVLRTKDSGTNGGSFFHFTDLQAMPTKECKSREKANWLRSATTFRRIRAMASPILFAPKREKDPKKRIVITGMGLVSVFGSDINTFYNKLLEGESGISLIDCFDTSNFPVQIGGQIRNFSSLGYIDEKNDRHLDNCWRYCLVAGKRALEDGNLGQQVLETMDRSRIGVLVGTCFGGMSVLNNGVKSLIQEGHKKITPFCIPYTMVNAGSALLAIDAGLRGPNYSISVGCASANSCFFAAANHIRKGEADIMVAGGTDTPLTPIVMSGLIAAKTLSQRNGEPQKASRPWDLDRDGVVLAEGSGVLVMESLEHAVKRGANIDAEYLGGATNFDAHHIVYPRPDGFGVSLCMINGLEDAGVSPEEVNYVNAYASSLPGTDIAELNAINKVFQDTSKIKMNSTKSMIGHSLGASGGIEAIVTIKALNTGWLHPTINQNNLEPAVTIDTVPNVKKQHEVNVDGFGVSLCMINSLEDAGVSPEEVNYVNAYASSVPGTDNAELSAINKVFLDTSEIKMNSTKSMIGHSLGASGGIEAIVTIKALNTGWLHPTINQNNLEPAVTIDTVPNVKKQHEVNVAISNSLGLGGHNAVAVFAPFKP